MVDFNKIINTTAKEVSFRDTPFTGFSWAVDMILKGNKVTRKEWGAGYYGYLKDGRLTLVKPDNKEYDWILNDGDMLAEDWITL